MSRLLTLISQLLPISSHCLLHANAPNIPPINTDISVIAFYITIIPHYHLLLLASHLLALRSQLLPNIGPILDIACYGPSLLKFPSLPLVSQLLPIISHCLLPAIASNIPPIDTNISFIVFYEPMPIIIYNFRHPTNLH